MTEVYPATVIDSMNLTNNLIINSNYLPNNIMFTRDKKQVFIGNTLKEIRLSLKTKDDSFIIKGDDYTCQVKYDGEGFRLIRFKVRRK